MRIPDESVSPPSSRSESAVGARLASRVRLEAFSDGVMAIAITLTVLSTASRGSTAPCSR